MVDQWEQMGYGSGMASGKSSMRTDTTAGFTEFTDVTSSARRLSGDSLNSDARSVGTDSIAMGGSEATRKGSKRRGARNGGRR